MTAALRVEAPGLMSTVQDLGRHGYQHAGVPVSGALDTVALRLANAIVGNSETMAGIEILFHGPALSVDAESVRLAVAGSGAQIELLDDSRTVPGFQSVRLRKGQRIRITPLNQGSVAYLAVEGGIAVEPVLGSRSTYVRGGFGGFQGRALTAGDLVPLAHKTVEDREEQHLPQATLPRPNRFRVVLGPQADAFTPKGMQTLFEATYAISQASDRMGMRLDGPVIEHRAGYEVISDGIAPGVIQVPGSGQPIVLLADRQTTGGYTKIGAVISTDLPALSRLAPGSTLSFAEVDRETAEEARRAFEESVQALTKRIVPLQDEVHKTTHDTYAAKLYGENLVSGVIDATDA